MKESEAELIKRLEALKDTGRELDGFERVEARTSKSPRAVFSLRIGGDELEEIEAAAIAIDQNIGEFIRQAALLRAREVTEKASVIGEVRTKARELTEALQRLYGKSA